MPDLKLTLTSHLKRAWLVPLLAVLALAAEGATAASASSPLPTQVYVSPTGTDSGSCSAAGSACASITYALTQVAPGGTIYVSGHLLDDGATADHGITVDQDVTIAAAPGATTAVIDAHNQDGLFDVTGNHNVTFDGLTLEHGYGLTTDLSAGITNAGTGTVTVENDVFLGNEAIGSGVAGGAIENSDGGTVAVSDSTFDENFATTKAAAIDNADGNAGTGAGTLTVTDSTFTDNGNGNGNAGNADGGAIDNGDQGGDGTLTVTDSTFDGNEGWDGGAIDNGDDSGNGTATISGSSFAGNSAVGVNGGAIDNGDNGGGGTVTITDSTFSDNNALSSNCGNGGAIDNADGSYGGSDGGGTVTISGSSFSGNDACGLGAAINNASGSTNGTATITDSSFTANGNGRTDGGAIDNADGNGRGGTGSLSVTDSTFDGNRGTDGGAIDNGDNNGTGTLAVTGTTFSANRAAGGYGGAIDSGNSHLSGNGDSNATITQSTFVGNEAPTVNTGGGAGWGGAIDNGFDNTGVATMTITQSTFADNSANGPGGTIMNSGTGGKGKLYTAADIFAVAPTVAGGTSDCLNGGSWTDAGYNASSTSSCLNGGPGDNDSSTTGAQVAADLGSLTQNGGPTETIMPTAGNPAIGLVPAGTLTVNGVTVTCPATGDQRGTFARATSGSTCDAGAVQTGGFLLLPQTVAFSSSPPSTATVGGTYATAASASSGLPVALTVDVATTNNACSLSGTTVTFAHAGTCVIDAGQAGGGKYAAAATVSQTIVVSAAATKVTVSVKSSALSATVTVTAPGAGTPTGTVDFYVDGASVGSGTLSGGVATLPYALGSTAAHTVIALYVGNADFSASSGVTRTQASGSGPSGPSAAQIRSALTALLSGVSGKAAKIPALRRAGGITLKFRAPSAGALVLHWYTTVKVKKKSVRETIATVTASYGQAAGGEAGVKVKLNGTGKRLLKTARRLRISESASFTPSGGQGTSVSRSVTLTR